MLSAERVSKSYKAGRRHVLLDTDFSLDRGEFYAVMGESGSGKSTLLAIIAGILKPDRGVVRLDDQDLYALPDHEIARIHQKKIGYVPQSNILLKNYTVLENLILPFLSAKDQNEEALKEEAVALLEKLGVSDLADRYPYELSGGEQKRVSLGRALLMDPEIVIADEPTTGLDSSTGRIILSCLAEQAASGKSVLVATHDDHVKEYAGRVLDITKI